MDGGWVSTRIRAAVARAGSPLAAAIVLFVATLLMIAPTGHADEIPAATRFAVGSPAILVAQKIAQDNWGTDACGGQVAIEWGSDDANINARSYWANPVSSYDNSDLNTQCRIVFNAGMTFSWPKFCTVLVHEYGHLTGHPHTADGPDVMSPIYREPLAACTTPEPGTAPTPAPAPVATPTTPGPAVTGVVTPVKRPSAKRTRTAVKTRGKSKARAAKARMADAELRHFSDANAEIYAF